jgi:hypothetical protein
MLSVLWIAAKDVNVIRLARAWTERCPLCLRPPPCGEGTGRIPFPRLLQLLSTMPSWWCDRSPENIRAMDLTDAILLGFYY